MPTLTIIKTFEWNVLNSLTIVKEFLWNVGSDIPRWYVVTAYPSDSICDGDCEGSNSNCVTQTIMASSVVDLAHQLKKLRWGKLIKKVQMWSRPALECDVRKLEKDGVSIYCNYLTDVFFCIPEMYSYIKVGDCPSLDNLIVPDGQQLVWYSEYVHISPTVSIGDPLVKGQKLGNLMKPPAFEPHLHFGVGDGQAAGPEEGGFSNIGQTFETSSIFGGCVSLGQRQVGTAPGTTTFSPEQVAYIMQNCDSPLDMNYCNWTQFYGSPYHSLHEYYAVDISCDGSTVVGFGPPRGSIPAEVYCACGGPDIITTVADIISDPSAGGAMLVKHVRYNQPQINQFLFAPEISPSFGILPCCMGGSHDPYQHGLLAQVDNIRAAGSGIVPSLLMLSHDIKFMSLAASLGLSYNKHSGCWEYSQHMVDKTGEWNFRCELHNGWQFSMQLVRGGKKSRFVIDLDEPGLFGVSKPILSLKVNLKTNKVLSKYKIRSLAVNDGTGIFKMWPELQLEIGL